MAVIFLDEFRPSLNCTKYNKLTNISNEIPLESVHRIIESLRLRKTLKIIQSNHNLTKLPEL